MNIGGGLRNVPDGPPSVIGEQYIINLHTDGVTDEGNPCWIALCGIDLQTGTVGCGNTPNEALNELIANLKLK